MQMAKKTMIAWSTGKDSAWMCARLLADAQVEVVGLFCNVHRAHERTAVHATRLALLQLQAERAHLPLSLIDLPMNSTNAQYESLMAQFAERAARERVEQFAFGDLFLDDIRQYRIKTMQSCAIEPLFPLWQCDTRQLAEAMIDGGVRAVVACVNPERLDETFLGRTFDREFINDLPSDVDPCGENGEFHTVVYDAPMFDCPIDVQIGATTRRGGLMCADVTLRN